MVAPFDLNLRHLRALSAIAARGSMSAAAEAIGLSQPALTQGLAKLERQLGERLFERRSDGVVPTLAGGALAKRSEAAMAHLGAWRGAHGRGSIRGFSHPERLMTSTQLNAFLHLANQGSFPAAAAATRLSEPALRRAVRDLEQICGNRLVERRGRALVLTNAGRSMARHVRLAAGEIEAGIVDLAADPAGGGRIAIGAMPLSRALVLPHAIARFVAGSPRALVDVIEGSWRELVDPLRDGVIDLMVGALREPPPEGLEQRALFKDRLVIVGRAGHPLANVATPSPEELAQFGWITGQSGAPLKLQWDMMFGAEAPAAPIACGSVMVIRGILRDSDLLTLLSPDQIALEIEGKVLTTIGRPLAQGARTIGLTTRVGWRPTAAQRRFVELLEKAARETRASEFE